MAENQDKQKTESVIDIDSLPAGLKDIIRFDKLIEQGELAVRKHKAKEIVDRYWDKEGVLNDRVLKSAEPAMRELRGEVEDFIEGKSDGVSPIAMELAQAALIGAERQFLTYEMALYNTANQFDEKGKHRLRLRQEQAQNSVDMLNHLMTHVVEYRLEERHIERDGLTQEQSQVQTKIPERQSPSR